MCTKFTHMMISVAVGEILPVIFLHYIRNQNICETFRLYIICTDNLDS